MNQTRINLLILLLILQCSTAFSQTINTIRFEGLKRTRASYLEHSVISSKAGNTADTTLIAADVQAILNLRHFASVRYELVSPASDPSSADLVFTIVENLSLLPNIDVGYTSVIYRAQLGIVDYNTFGKSGVTNLYVKQFGRLTLFYSGDYPHILGGKKGLFMNFQKSATYEPFYFNSRKIEYSYDLWTFIALFRYDFNPRSFLRAGGGYQFEDFGIHKADTLSPLYKPNGNADRAFMRFTYKYTNTNFNKFYARGYIAEVLVENILSDATAYYGTQENQLYGSGYKGLLDLRYYFIPYKGSNTAVRLRTGYTTMKKFDQFAIDDNINMRGVGFKPERRDHELTLNIEHRQTVYQRPLGAIVLVGFSDNTPDIHFAGLGFRFYVEKLHGLIFRTDYGININDVSERGIVAGIHQYF